MRVVGQTDDGFHTAEALDTDIQDVWVRDWGGNVYRGRGVPGESDEPQAEATRR